MGAVRLISLMKRMRRGIVPLIMRYVLYRRDCRRSNRGHRQDDMDRTVPEARVYVRRRQAVLAYHRHDRRQPGRKHYIEGQARQRPVQPVHTLG